MEQLCLKNDVFGLICQNKEIFSSFMDFSTPIRKEFRHLDIFFYVVTTYPKTFTQIMAILKKHNYTAINMCRLFLANCESNIFSILSHNTRFFSPSICTFLAQIFINKMIFSKQSEEIGLTVYEKNQIHRALTQELSEIQ